MGESRLAAELKRYAEAERRSGCATIRIALEDRLRPTGVSLRSTRAGRTRRTGDEPVADQARLR
jgi:hypothetical protein